jgi:hypothetical protein
MGFPNIVAVQNAIAVEGDFASVNPRATVIAGVGAFLAGAAGLTVGAFAWADPAFTFLNSFGSGPVTGFIGREGQRADIITPGPGYPDSSMTILGGSYITAYSSGDFYVRNKGTTTSVIGNTCYAFNNSGLCSFGAAGTPPAGAVLTTITVTANTFNVSAVAPNTATGSIAGTTLTVTAIGSGTVLAAGQTMAGTGVDPGTSIIRQITGTAGNTGTYQVSISQTVGSVSLTMSGAGLTVTSMTNGVVYVGQTISGGTNAVSAGTTVTALGTGTGGAGTYALNNAQTCASIATATGSGGYLTLTTLASGALVVGDTVTSASGSATILPFGIGGTTGVGIGGGTTYVVSSAAGTGDTSGTVAAGVATKWFAMSVGAPGELVAVSTVPLG